MRKSSSFMCVLTVLLAGGAEAQRPIAKDALLGLVTLSAITGVEAWRPQDGCVPMGTIYTDGPDMLKRMWNDAFEVVDDESRGYTMWWFEGGAAGSADGHDNPNDAITRAIWNQSPPDTCDVQYYHKDEPSPEGSDFTECHPWHANSCCHQATVVTPQALSTAYGSGYEWDRCGPLSQACERFFVMEACFYECEVNTGLYRKYTDAQHTACSAEGVADGAYIESMNYTCQPGAWGGNDENRWQLYKMPIRRSFADAWYRACANDLFCGTGDYFACAGDYHAQIEAEAAAQEAARGKVPDYGIALIAVAAVILVCLVVCLCVLAGREKAGKPVFQPMSSPPAAQPAAAATTEVEISKA